VSAGIGVGTVVYEADSGENGKVTWISHEDPGNVIAGVDFGNGEADFLFVPLEDLVRAASQEWPS
jgi:hypothetical protein